MTRRGPLEHDVLLRTLRLQGALRGVSATDPIAMAANEPRSTVWEIDQLKSAEAA